MILTFTVEVIVTVWLIMFVCMSKSTPCDQYFVPYHHLTLKVKVIDFLILIMLVYLSKFTLLNQQFLWYHDLNLHYEFDFKFEVTFFSFHIGRDIKSVSPVSLKTEANVPDKSRKHRRLTKLIWCQAFSVD